MKRNKPQINTDEHSLETRQNIGTGKSKQNLHVPTRGPIVKHAFRKVTLGERLILVWGKLRRFYYHNCNTRYIKESHARRTGECARCGACCYLAHPCPSLAWEENGLTYCKIHQRRVKNCRIFPIDEKDIADRDLILPDTPCGYSFKPKKDKDKSRG